MLNEIEEWIDQTSISYEDQRISCSCFIEEFNGFYPASFLNDSYFVVVSDIPKPDFPILREMGLGSFIDMAVGAITYKNTYYIHSDVALNHQLHFHELVHIAQWQYLG